ncbi:hypothetical protein BGZ51_000714 [Haplosporangium sp. Z 767]|nr:hypothetical protein BGZ50_001515 [Haplosporangium sp. Z 11]KAF9188253.1 hypothetical protein BGZ51_000714 [Haplosporangium sp. Z 767]
MDQDRNPLDLPELRMIIRQFMNKKTLAACVLVSKAWYKAFVPFLWETIKLGERRNYRFKKVPLDGFRNTRNWVRSVHLDHEKPIRMRWNEMPIFPNLKALKAEMLCTSSEDHIMSMIAQHPLITHMDLTFDVTYNCVVFWDLIVKQVHLVDLKLKYMTFWHENVDAFITTCSRLHSLSLDGISSEDMLDNVDLPVFPIRNLYLINTKWQENNFLLFSTKCPDLETFNCVDFFSTFSESFWHSFSVSIASGTWLRLENLGLCLSHISDEDLATILTSMPRIQKLNASLTAFGELAFAALRPHLKTDVKLNLRYCNVTTTMVTEILQASPNINPQNFACIS